MNTVVIIKGQLRTWHENKQYLKAYVADFVKNTVLAGSDSKIFSQGKVDILFCCWDVSYQLYPDPFVISYLQKESTEAQDIIGFFKDSEVVRRVYFEKLSFLDAQGYFESIGFSLDEEYHFQCYLTYKAGIHKRKIEVESGSEYDLVVELRPDVFYEYESAGKVLTRPGFGEILSLNGNAIVDVHGFVSPMTEDLIFFMSGRTYNIYSKEVLFHYRNHKSKKQYSTAHAEKNLFFMANNFQVNDMNNGLCSLAVIMRPTLDWERLHSAATNLERLIHIRQTDDHWRGDKDRRLDLLMRQGQSLEHMASYEENVGRQNLEKIREVLR